MLLGVLVIAFPVSVFSDLWSKELRKSGAFRALDDDDDDEDDNGGGAGDDAGKGENGEIGMETLPETRKGSDRRLSLESLPEETASPLLFDRKRAADSDHIVIRKDDLTEMVAHFQTITDSQRQIRAILKKYHHHHHHHQA
jgi:hypothetical protein